MSGAERLTGLGSAPRIGGSLTLRTLLEGGFGRLLLISCAVVQGVIGAASVGLVGWDAFLFMMVSLGLIVWALVGYDDTGEPRAPRENGSPQNGDGHGPAGPHPEPSAT